jgi:predicted lipoprotein with Yx(FWY)xxD motif
MRRLDRLPDDALLAAIALGERDADGIVPDQITYHGHLLYYFVGDQAPGDINGVGIPDWYAVDPAGNAIENS